MQSACRIDEHHVGAVCLGALQGVERHACRVASHLLFHYRHAHALAPDANLLYGSGTEGVGSSQNNFLASLLKLVSQLADGGCLAHAVYAYYEDNVRLMVGRKFPVCQVIAVILGEENGDFLAQNAVELAG